MLLALRRLLAASLATGAAAVLATPLRADLYAERLTTDNIAALRVGGPDAIAGVGDWVFGNGTLCAAVSDPEHESILSPRGGVLIDLGHCGRDDDQFNLIQPLMNLSRANVVSIDDLRAEFDDREARISTRGTLHGVRVDTRYRLGLERPDALIIETTLERRAEGERVFLFGDVCLHGHRQTSPFTASTTRPEHSVGFAHPPVDVDSALAMVRAIVPANLQVMVGGDRLEPGVSYGLEILEAQWESADGTREDVPYLAVNGEDFSLLGIFGRDFWIGGDGPPGLVEMAQTLWMDLEVGERLHYTRALWVGRRADVASVTDFIWPAAARVVGSVDDPTARLHVSTREGAPITEVRPEADGRYAFRAPPGDYVLRAHAPGGRTVSRTFALGSDELRLSPLRVGAPTRVTLPSGRPMRLVFVGLGETPNPGFGDDLLGFRVGDRTVPASTLANHVSLYGGPLDPDHVDVAPGRYRVHATRGPEFSVETIEIDARAGNTATLAIGSPKRLFETPGWLSADLHVHSQPSDDSSLPLDLQIAAFAAEATDVLVSTEHDRVWDYAPVIARLGFADRMASLIGAEVTSTVMSEAAPHTFGHVNAFPLPLRPDAYRGGAPASEGRRLRRLVGAVRGLGGTRIVQLNHPRGSRGHRQPGSFFTHLSVPGEPFDPTLPLDSPRNRVLVERDAAGLRDIDFDAMELMNGASELGYRLVHADWLSLLLQGEYRTGTANSDSHRLGEIAALPRNYVRVSGGSGPGFQAEAFVRAVKRGHLYGTTGPLVDVRLGDAGPGDRFRGARGTLTLAVRAAPWVPVETARIWIDADVASERTVRSGETLRIPLEFTRDAFVTVQIEGPARGIYLDIAPGFTPLAFTNPIFVDVDGDGRWTAPGLPDPPPASLRIALPEEE